MFDEYALEYDAWFDDHSFAYQSEIEAIKYFIPGNTVGIEIGAGTGRFSIPFGVNIGVEPSKPMAAIARSRGMNIHIACAEKLPFDSGSFGFVLLVTTICFVDDIRLTLREAHRVLKPEGKIIIGFVDKNSFLGKIYEAQKDSDKFYKKAKFYSTSEIIKLVEQTDFSGIETCQTIFSNPEEMTEPDIIKNGSGEGAFVVVSAVKHDKSYN